MIGQAYQTDSVTSLSDYIGRTMRTSGCTLLYCMEGCAIAECNFTEMPLRKGGMAIIFVDTLFSMKKISRAFKVRRFELSVALTDESTFTSGGALFDWLYEHPVFAVPPDRGADMGLWLAMMDWVEANSAGSCRNIMLRNQWHSFFLGLESVLRGRLAGDGARPTGAARRLFDGFCKLLSENCRRHHQVRFYADKLCVTPYYLSRITHRMFAVSPKELIDRQIVMEIKSLLGTTELSVKEIANLYGFDSSSYLGRYLRRHIGMTPSEYRNRTS